jgi:nucleotide sugar dehydrogenase
MLRKQHAFKVIASMNPLKCKLNRSRIEGRLRIAITGLGHVGTTIADWLGDENDLTLFDIKNGSPYPSEKVSLCDVEFVCVGTPEASDGSCDLSQVETAVNQSSSPLIILKSTVPPGTTRRLSERSGRKIVHSPEFFGELPSSSAFWSNELDMPFTILGGEPEDVAEAKGKLEQLRGSDHIFFSCNSTESEVIKYMENCFLAMKVTFCNEFYSLTKLLELDWDSVRKGWLLDPRVGESHTVVNEDDPGFGGRCFPKDTRAIAAFARNIGHNLPLMQACIDTNERIRSEFSSHRLENIDVPSSN